MLIAWAIAVLVNEMVLIGARVAQETVRTSVASKVFQCKN